MRSKTKPQIWMKTRQVTQLIQKEKKNINKHGLLKFTRTQETIYNSKSCNRIVTTFFFSFRVLEISDRYENTDFMSALQFVLRQNENF